MTTPLDIEQFNRACSRYGRGVLTVAGLAIVTAFGCFAVVLPFKQEIRAFYMGHFGAGAAEILMGLTPFPAIPVMFAGFWWLHRLSKKTPELLCPHCKKSIVGMRHIVVATKNCPHCGRRVLAEPDGRRT